MAIEYLGVKEISGPLVVLENVKGASYEEIVEIDVGGKEKRMGQIISIDGDKAVAEGLIDRLGGLSDAIESLYELIEAGQEEADPKPKQKRGRQKKAR